MNGVVPVVIVIGNHSIPATVVRFKGVMRPAYARVCAGNDNLLPGETQRPDIRRVRVCDPRFDRHRDLRLERLFNRFRKGIVNDRVAFYPRHIRPAGQCLGDLPAALH